MTFLQARYYHPGRLRPLRLIVLHCTQSPQTSGGAEATQRWFADPNTRVASAHVTIDPTGIAESVHEQDTAFGAASANSDGYHVEHTGYITDATWSVFMLDLSAKHTADVAARNHIPARLLTVTELRDGITRGFVTHALVQEAFPSSGHTDPGDHFPLGDYLLKVAKYLQPVSTPPPAPKPPTSVPPFPREPGDDGLIRKGDRGREVVAVQARLKARGWTIDVDGDFGSGTERVVTAFQREKNLTTDGCVGPKTWAALWTAKVTA